LATQAFGRGPVAVTAAHDGVTLIAKAMTTGERIDTFYKDLRDDRIFPVALSISNNSNQTLKLNAENIEISGATILTPKRLESKITSMSFGAVFLTIIIFPIGLLLAHQLAKLQALEPIIKKFSIGDTSIVIQPHEKIEKILFAEVDSPKDIDGKTQSFIAPQYLDIEVSLKNNSFFSFQAPVFFGLRIPTF